MKKLLTLIIAVLYVGTSTGATFQMHYCMGKLVGVALWEDAAGKCDKCKAGHHKKATCQKQCCKDAHKTVKLEKDQKVAENALNIAQHMAVAVPVPGIELPRVQVVTVAEELPLSNAPPRSGKVHTYLLNCTFLI